ncbi:putative inorganic phosphate cotransporter isoform X2 [Arctopsyche grandis]|uniref:putative inorganic phosphate cotransporter isoform X2 n=1 Tax=Arctopsyche grandis TaxID=121162 RepID=UPI00406D6920
MLTGWRKTVSKFFLIPQRWVFAIMGFLAVGNAYTMRVTLNLAITVMSPKDINKTIESMCENKDCTEEFIQAYRDDTFDWDETTQGFILSAFFYGYVITHLPGGIIAEKFGGKYSLGLGILSTAVLTLLTPVVARSGGSGALIALRALEGLGEGTTFPALNALLAQWAPLEERGRIGSLVFGGAQIGNIAGTLFSGILLQNGNWASVFYLFGGLGILWFILWVLLCYSDPMSHPFISDEEKKYLEEALGGQRSKDVDIPWIAILTCVPLWALVCAQVGHDWGYFTMVTDLPKYMTDVLGFDVLKTGVMATLPYIVMWITSITFGIICDYCIKHEHLSVTNARKIFTTIASIGPGVCIIGASYVGDNEAGVVALFTIAMGLMGAFYPGMKVNALDLSCNYAGTLMAIVNGIGALSGIITPLLVGLLTPNTTQEEWRTVFWIVFGVFIVTNGVFVMWASGEEQWWNDIPKHGYPETWTRKRKYQKEIEVQRDDIDVGKDNQGFKKDETNVATVNEHQM